MGAASAYQNNAWMESRLSPWTWLLMGLIAVVNYWHVPTNFHVGVERAMPYSQFMVIRGC